MATPSAKIAIFIHTHLTTIKIFCQAHVNYKEDEISDSLFGQFVGICDAWMMPFMPFFVILQSPFALSRLNKIETDENR